MRHFAKTIVKILVILFVYSLLFVFYPIGILIKGRESTEAKISKINMDIAEFWNT